MRTADERYEANLGALTEDENRSLRDRSVCIVGCGGLGGGAVGCLARAGAGMIRIIDPDVFEPSNLNRQLFATEGSVGRSKALEAVRRTAEINSGIVLEPVVEKLDRLNGRDMLRGHDAVVDAVDDVKSKLLLEEICSLEGIPLIHGAVEGWLGQVSVVMPGGYVLRSIYGGPEDDRGAPGGTPGFTAAAVSAVQAAETVRMLTGRGSPLENKVLRMDLLEHEYEVIDFGR